MNPLMLPLELSAVLTLLEGLMLLCFGVAWPVANMRMLRTRLPEGKGLAFTLIILCGYAAGTTAKLVLTAQGQPPPPRRSGHGSQPAGEQRAAGRLGHHRDAAAAHEVHQRLGLADEAATAAEGRAASGAGNRPAT